MNDGESKAGSGGYTAPPWVLNGRAIEQKETPGRHRTWVIAYVEDEENDAWRENGEAIVRAVNNHEAMRKALRDLLSSATSGDERFRAAFVAAKAALAEAEKDRTKADEGSR